MDAPTHVTWSEHNHSPLIRVPDRRGISARALPANLSEAVLLLEKSKLMRDTLGEHIFHNGPVAI